MNIYVLDTNIVSLIVRNDIKTKAKFDEVIRTDDLLIGCPMVWHEVRRGLIFRDSRSQMKRFLALFASFDWQETVTIGGHNGANLVNLSPTPIC